MKYIETKYSVETILDKIKDTEINISPDYQREYVWSSDKASLLIDSLVKNNPLDPIILYEVSDNKYELVDGKQRIKSIEKFIDNELNLIFRKTNLNNLSPILSKKKNYKDLTSDEKKMINRRLLNIIIIISDTTPSDIIEFFKRKNTGGQKLNNQEIRSGIAGGAFKKDLRDLQKNKKFIDLWGEKIWKLHSDKQKTDENILKFFGFVRIFIYGDGIKDYKIMSKFLDENIKFFANDENLDKKNKIIEIFNFSVKKCHDIFYTDNPLKINFQPFRKNVSENFNWIIAMAQLLGFGLIYTESDNSGLRKKSDEIRNAMIELIKEHDILLSQGTNDKFRINQFFNAWFDTLFSILEPIEKNTRYIQNNLILKVKLYGENNICSKCGCKIIAIKNADLDHIFPHAKGGSNLEHNLRLTHYNCNRADGGSGIYDDDDDDDDDDDFLSPKKRL